ncbi:MAG: hypothetical protein J1E05_01250 [Eubacterium sp.]|nr:hypothetical protein [Eubacterium sp.]
MSVTNYKYIFVHGLCGWGHYDKMNRSMPYWGTRGGSLMDYLKAQGFDCYDASVAPKGSAWDRACELYAQLTGSVVDYGKAHSEKYGHERFGRDFSSEPLITDWSAENKINILGHSFGGATVRLFAHILAYGSEEERNATDTDDISPFFVGGKGDWLYSLTSLSAPHNGTTAYSAREVLSQFRVNIKPLDIKARIKTIYTDIMVKFLYPDKNRVFEDTAEYDMYLDNALALNEKIETLPNVYYFSYPTSCCEKQADGTYMPTACNVIKIFRETSEIMGKHTGVTPGGYSFDESWLDNDGLVNTNSSTAPFNAPSTEFDKAKIEAGIWNVMQTYRGDHMSLQGGKYNANEIREFYKKHLTMINKIGR